MSKSWVWVKTTTGPYNTAIDPLELYVGLQLLGGWSDPIPRTVLKEELLLAAIRCHKILPQYSFQLDTSIDSLEALREMISDLQLDKDDPKKVIVISLLICETQLICLILKCNSCNPLEGYGNLLIKLYTSWLPSDYHLL